MVSTWIALPLLLVPLPLVTLEARAQAPSLTSGEARAACSEHNRLRNPYFGDLHVHTVLSLDANTQGTRNTPHDAYRFARGEPLGIQPYDRAGNALRILRLERPLDFAAVTDHAELFGEVITCTTPGLPGYRSPVCLIYRWWPRLAFFVMNSRSTFGEHPERYRFCGPGAAYCLGAALKPWKLIKEAAEAAYDRTPACRFTSFVGYEWTGGPQGNNIHRNVIFLNEKVPELPVSYFDASRPEDLWRRLAAECIDGVPGCDLLTIPHNSNLSGGLMFETVDRQGQPISVEYARSRAQFEPLVEVIQHKGDSECRPGAGTEDELCAFEKLPYDNFGGKYARWRAREPGPSNFVRHALKQGLIEEQRLGVNPFKYGLVGSTDTHLAASGAVEEKTHPGHGGAGAPAATELPRGLPDDIELNPGGLAVLWAEENSRDALFAAMRRREAYATSGPRIVVRFFGGWSLPRDMCSGPAFVEQGYAAGAPMGSDLPTKPPDLAGQAPRFAVSALRDPGTRDGPGTLLQRIQIIKGWLEGDQARERVYQVAGAFAGRDTHGSVPPPGAFDERGGATVDLDSCRPSGPGSKSLCEVWTDPDFDPRQGAFYYARVLENPTCRWSTHLCQARRVNCEDPSTVGEGLEGCCDARYPKTIQERAWSSPIWYRPPARPDASAMHHDG